MALKNLFTRMSSEKFKSLKVASDSTNTQYYDNETGLSVYGTPDVSFEMIVFIEDTKQIWTHGIYYAGAQDIEEDITYAELVSLRNSSGLTPGQQYAITDYQCTTTQDDTSAATHQFDVIVFADTNCTLSENARARKHSGDTYFAKFDLNSWELKYSLDNDTDKYVWADSTNGKGVIYHMKDDYSNECAYDFKNILFKRKLTNGKLDEESGTDSFVYTFNSYNSSTSQNVDACTLIGETVDYGPYKLYSNVIKEFYSEEGKKLTLNNNVFLNGSEPFECYDNTFGPFCHGNTLGDFCTGNEFKSEAFDNILGDNCYRNIFSFYTEMNILGNECYENRFGSSCSSNNFGDGCQGNTFGNKFAGNSFNGYLTTCFFGNHVMNINFKTNYTDVSSEKQMSNIQVLNGLGGDTSYVCPSGITYNTIYSQFVGHDTDGNIKIWVPADTDDRITDLEIKALFD